MATASLRLLGVPTLLLALTACGARTQASPPSPEPVAPVPPQTSPAGGVFTQRVLSLTNAARTCGTTGHAAAPALSASAQLGQAAQGHASNMATRNYFSHTSQDGRTLADRINATGYRWSTIGENIAAGQPIPEDVVSGWLSSPGHCRNIMNPAFRELGVGYVQGGSHGHSWVQNFGTSF